MSRTVARQLRIEARSEMIEGVRARFLQMAIDDEPPCASGPSGKFVGPVSERPGLPVPRRRTFAAGILPSALSDADCTPQSLLRLSAYAGSRGTGNPAPTTMKKPE